MKTIYIILALIFCFLLFFNGCIVNIVGGLLLLFQQLILQRLSWWLWPCLLSMKQSFGSCLLSVITASFRGSLNG